MIAWPLVAALAVVLVFVWAWRWADARVRFKALADKHEAAITALLAEHKAYDDRREAAFNRQDARLTRVENQWEEHQRAHANY